MPKVDQRGAVASGDIVAGNKTTINNFPAQPKLTKIESLKERLKGEVEAGEFRQETIDRLQDFYKRIPADGVVGLEAKLEVAGRSHQLMIALDMKEKFSKLLEKWSLYASAQEIFVHLLARAEYKFSHHIYPMSNALSHVQVDELVEDKIISPAIEEIGADIFSLDHQTAMGMIYWLAEQCRIRWHQ
jgi:hypothetical protein